MGVSQTEFRKAMGSFATGVTVITVDYEGEVHGMTPTLLRRCPSIPC
jgi:flavin reductase (DIM6/NTAB) family NADH-FMN oxidoreductase RutF